MAAVEIADAYVALYAKMPGVTADITNALGGSDVQSALGNSGKSMGSLLTGAIGGAVALGLSKVVSTVTSAIDGAIGRVDTMRNFPKVMGNLGYSVDDASASIATMSDRLSGLPTSLDSMTGMVQQLAPISGSLKDATDLSLAFNNALLAGGKSTDIQANAMEQYTQMLSVGKVDMAAWRSMVTAMPGQMNQVSQSLLGTGASAMDLYAAMQNGTISFDQFNGAILELNENGVNGFASFEQQARSSTDGIATGQANMQTAITRGLAKLIDKFQPQITGMLAGITTGVNVAFGAISDAIDWIASNMDLVIPIVSGLAVGLLVVLAPAMWAAAAAAWGFTAALLANPMTWIVLAVVLLVAAIVALAMNWDKVVKFLSDTWAGFVGWITDVLEGFAGWWGEVWDGLLGFIQPVFDAIGAIFTWLYESIILPVVTGIMLYIGLWAAIFTWLWETVVSPVFAALGAAFQWIWASIIQPVVNFIVAYVQLLAAIFLWLWQNAIDPAIKAIGAAFQWVWDSIIQPVSNFIVAVIQGVGAVVSWLWSNAINPAIQAIAGGFQWVWANVIQPVAKFISDAITNVGNTVRSVFDGISGFVGAAFQSVLSVVRGPINALIDMINGIIRGLNSINVKIPSWVPLVGGQSFGLNIASIPRLADGALVTARPGGVLANIGEGRYDEVVQPLGGPQFDSLADALARKIGGRGGGDVTFNAPVYTYDPDELARDIQRRQRDANSLAGIGSGVVA